MQGSADVQSWRILKPEEAYVNQAMLLYNIGSSTSERQQETG
jgi:hypothetical protein